MHPLFTPPPDKVAILGHGPRALNSEVSTALNSQVCESVG
jgi:hypothetical protein